jgi:hypothetical protein
MNKSLTSQYQYAMPSVDLNKSWEYDAQLQPSVRCKDSIPMYGIGRHVRVDYDGIYKPRETGKAKCSRYDHKTHMAMTCINNEDYGHVRTHFDITNNYCDNLEYVNSEIKIAKNKGDRIRGYDEYYPVRDPIRTDFPAQSNIDYDAVKEYDWNSKTWTVRDLPNYGRYPVPVSHLDFSKKISLFDPELVANTSGADACRTQRPRDEYDPIPDEVVYDSLQKYRKVNGKYHPPLTEEARYRNLVDRSDVANKEKFFSPGINFVSLDQARSGYSKARAPKDAMPGRDKTLTWEEIQDQKNMNWAKNGKSQFSANARLPDQPSDQFAPQIKQMPSPFYDRNVDMPRTSLHVQGIRRRN